MIGAATLSPNGIVRMTVGGAMFGKRARELREIEADIKATNERIEAKKDALASAVTRVVNDANKAPRR